MPRRRDNSASSLPPSTTGSALLNALARAPEDDEIETREEIAAVAAGRRDISDGNVLSSAEVREMVESTKDRS